MSVFFIFCIIYREVDENDSDLDVGDDDLLADGEGIPDDDTDEVQPQE